MLDMIALPDDTQKPRIALMGEFSAGKSTLSNLMLGAKPLPERVTATQLPPVWMCYGSDEAYREDLEGNRHPVSLDKLEDVPLAETLYIKIFLETDILTLCDLIDMPGISDPNMPPEVWQRMVARADSVLWCTHATQAWRQSEAAVWETIPESLYAKSLLLITRIDKILTERDRKKLLRRVQAETEGLFSGTFPIALLAAVAAGEDQEQWEASGAEAFTDRLIDLIQELVVEKGQAAQNGDRFDLETPYCVTKGADKAPVDRMEDVSSFDATTESSGKTEAEPDRVETPEAKVGSDSLFDQEIEQSYQDDFGASYEGEFEEGGDGFGPEAEQAVPTPLEPLRLEPAAHLVAKPYVSEEDRSEMIDEHQPNSESGADGGKGDLLPQLAPPEDGVSEKVVIPRRVRKVSANGTVRAERPRRPAADIGIESEQKKVALSPLNNLSNLRGVFSKSEETQSGRAD